MANHSLSGDQPNSNIPIITFGEQKGCPISEVENGRLMYYAKWKFCPLYVGYELVRRGYKRTKLPVNLRRRMKADMKARGEWVTQTPKNNGAVIVGKHYEWLRLAYLQSGGDESACPFGDDYAGPTLMYEDDEPFIYTPLNKEK